MKRYFFAIMLVINLVLLAGCNTMSGIGQDIEQAGDAIEKAATKNKTY
ncbi:entericidin A/B family lipoprotein [Desulfopila aestuarii]|uniref:Predicted small secreted protein n=1 Tax=Desulfopila aestuarii DSM 18488 TaxID=1121416 RepID=A0A1M7Y4G5_9BACT|nr:entericidin A/B family lipoprotein [Desulfopila aestuarii]SHO47206.1 Predicted small secreted protein [Desulfopila aestuarii DSM 18488]